MKAEVQTVNQLPLSPEQAKNAVKRVQIKNSSKNELLAKTINSSLTFFTCSLIVFKDHKAFSPSYKIPTGP